MSNFTITKSYNTKLENLEAKDINEISELKSSESYSYEEIIALLKKSEFDKIRLKEFKEL